MSTHKSFDKICVAAIILALLISIVFIGGEAVGIQAAEKTLGYEEKLFDTGKVHTIDIIMDDWDSFIETCENEEYSACSIVIDGEAFGNVGIRAKGNTSLSTVSSMNSERYSFKIEFDQYDAGKSYHGLDKLSLNNLIQDSTYMKDYLTYQMMGEFGVAAPLCSYVYITVNGEDWGLYLAVEAVEDSFLQRNYGNSYGDLYKPDSMEIGGGRGNGRDFNMEDFFGSESENESPFAQMPQRPQIGGMEMPEDFKGREKPQMGGGMPGGDMGGSGTKLQYIDDDPESYSVIFDSAKTDVTAEDKERLVSALKTLGDMENVEDALDIDAVLKYFVVHNFVVNGDSYTGGMIHNYYLYENDGLLSMIPWDYNLAYGTFQGNDARSAVNDPIDSPLSTGSGDRPMAEWIYSDEEYTELYHQYFAEFLDSVDYEHIINNAFTLIAPYVEKDPTAFYDYEEFEKGVQTLLGFCSLREESVRGQLNGTIPSTDEGQNDSDENLVDASGLNLSDMGSMSMGGGDRMPQSGDRPSFGENGADKNLTENMAIPDGVQIPSAEQMSGGIQNTAAVTNIASTQMPGNMQMPEGMEFPSNMQMPEGMEFPDDMQLPDGMEIPNGMQMPENSQAESDSKQEDTQAKPESGNSMQMPSFGSEFGQSTTVNSMEAPILLVVSVAVMAIGLLVAFLYKRK